VGSKRKRRHKGPRPRLKLGPAFERRPTKPGVEARPVAPGVLAWCNRWGLIVVIALALVYAVAFCAISHFKYRHFNYFDYDLAIFSNAMWNTAHGHFMFTEIRAGCYFKDHVPAILLLLVPLYKLFPSPLTLLYAQAVMLGAAAVPLFLLARRELNGFWGILFALMVLLYPAVGFINLFEFHALAFVPVLMLFTLYLFRAKKYVLFLVLAALTMFCREEVALTVMMIGLYALIARRRWPWIVAPAAAGLAWFLVSFYLIIPHFNQGENIYGELYSDFGKTPLQVLKTAITRPGYTINYALKKDPHDARVDKPGYLQKTFAPTSYLALANPEALLMTAPQFALNLLVDTRKHAPPPTIYFQYTATLIPVLFFSSVLGLARLMRVRVLKQFWLAPAAVVLLISATTWVLWSPQLAPAKGQPRNMAGTQLQHRADAAYYRQMLDAMPGDVPVVATFRFLHHLTNRHVLTSFHYIYMGREKVAAERPRTLPDEVSYALLDLNYGADWTQFATPDGAQHFLELLAAGDWGIETRRGQLILLRKHAPELPKLICKVEEPTVANRFEGRIEFGNTVRLLGADDTREPLDGDLQVRLRTAWEFVNPLPGRLAVDYALFDKNGRVVEVGDGTQAVHVTAELGQFALAPNVWLGGDRFEVEHALIIPAAVPAGPYALGVICVPSVDVRWPIEVPPERRLPSGYCRIADITLTDGEAP
jgi:uncharacterized membrane protein